MLTRRVPLVCMCSLAAFLTLPVAAQTKSAAYADPQNGIELADEAIPVNRAIGSVAMDSNAFVFLPAVTYAAGQYPDAVAVADVNGDGHPDLVVANGCLTSTNCTYSGVSVLLGNGDGTFQTAVTYTTGQSDATSIAVGDFNGDGHPDIVVANDSGLSVLLVKGDGTFHSAVIYSSGGSLPSSVAIGDVNGDGHPDLVVANWASHTVGVLLGKGAGTFRKPVPMLPGLIPIPS